ncbi:hypothetical protein HK097_001660, partial [Rhizophlyctis rosea]
MQAQFASPASAAVSQFGSAANAMSPPIPMPAVSQPFDHPLIQSMGQTLGQNPMAMAPPQMPLQQGGAPLAAQPAPAQPGAQPIAVPLIMPGANGQMQTSFALVSPQILLQAALANGGQSIPGLGGAGLGADQGGQANIVTSLLQVIGNLLGNQQQQQPAMPQPPVQQPSALQQIASMAQGLGQAQMSAGGILQQPAQASQPLGQSSPANAARTSVVEGLGASPEISNLNLHSSPSSVASSLTNLAAPAVQNCVPRSSPSNPAGLPAGMSDGVSGPSHATT